MVLERQRQQLEHVGGRGMRQAQRGDGGLVRAIRTREPGAQAQHHGVLRIVGINTAVAGIGLGLAVPVNDTTRRIISALLRDGRVRRAYLGLVSTPVPLPAPLATRTGQRRALRVVEVVTGSPADQAGLRPGDLVLSAGRRPVADAQSLQRLLFGEAVGVPLPVTVLRNDAMVDVIAVPAELSRA